MRFIQVLAEDVLGPRANHTIGALLQVPGRHIGVDHDGYHVLPVFQLAVVEEDFGAGGLYRQAAQPFAPGANRHGYPPAAGGGRKAYGQHLLRRWVLCAN